MHGREFEIGGRPLVRSDDDLARVRFATSLGPGTLSLPRRLLDAWLREADPDANPDAMQPIHRALLLEALLSAELGWLEAQLNCEVELTEITQEADERDASPLLLAWSEVDQARRGEIVLGDPRLAESIEGLLDSAVDTASLFASSVPIPLRIVVGAASVTLGELEGLEPGDVILLQGNGHHSARSHCVIGALRAAPIVAADNGWRLTDRFTSLTGSEWDFDMATERKIGLDETEEDTALPELPITLVFEAGRTAIPLDQVRRLDSGSLIPLDGPADGRVTIFASGKRVGRGELVKLGEGLGVRVVNIFAND